MVVLYKMNNGISSKSFVCQAGPAAYKLNLLYSKKSHLTSNVKSSSTINICPPILLVSKINEYECVRDDRTILVRNGANDLPGCDNFPLITTSSHWSDIASTFDSCDFYLGIIVHMHISCLCIILLSFSSLWSGCFITRVCCIKSQLECYFFNINR